MSSAKKGDKKVIHGGRNLVLMAMLATTIAIVCTMISLAIYRGTGDIYLDRSRPGFIAEDEKHNVEDDGKEGFSAEGAITKSDVEEYLKTLDLVDRRIRDSSEDFSSDPISDETLGITSDDADVVEETTAE